MKQKKKNSDILAQAHKKYINKVIRLKEFFTKKILIIETLIQIIFQWFIWPLDGYLTKCLGIKTNNCWYRVFFNSQGRFSCDKTFFS